MTVSRRTILSAPLALAMLVWAGGCAQNRSVGATSVSLSTLPATEPADSSGLLPPQPMQAIQTLSPVPVGWTPDPPKHSPEHDHQAWISPSGRTAYGVITFHHWLLPFASDALVLEKFLDTMRQSEGEARLIVTPIRDPSLDGLRFVAEGGLYTVRGNLVTHGTRGWVVYAGTLRNQPVMPDELKLAERAREQTVIGIPQHASAD
jgi:hypothetical protein